MARNTKEELAALVRAFFEFEADFAERNPGYWELVAEGERKAKMAKMEENDREFNEALDNPEFRKEVMDELMRAEGIVALVAFNRTNTRARLFAEARKHNLI